MTSNIKILEQYGTLRRNLMLQVSAKIKGLPFGHRQIAMLRVIHRGREITLGKLAETVGTDPGTVSRSIAQMIQLGWVEKEQSRNDGRLWSVRLTLKGLKQMPNIDEIYSSIADMMMGGLEHGECEQFFALLSKINGTFAEKAAQ